MGPFWAVVQLQPRREAFALRMLARADFTVYAPRLREWRTVRGKGQRQRELALFPGYAFLLVRLQWHAARWCPGVIRLVMDGFHPAKVPDAVIAEIRAREVNGLVELPPRPPPRPGDTVRIVNGVLRGRLAIFAGLRGHERVEVLLGLLGRVTLPSAVVEPA